MRVESWSGTNVGLVRASNEDSVGCFPELGLFVVCDGLGGHASGEVASRLAVEAVRDFVARDAAALGEGGLFERTRRLLGRSAPRSEEDLLREAAESANLRVLAAPEEGADGEERSMATTVVALRVLADKQRLAWAHVGDSRLYRVRNGNLELLTADHTVAGSRYLGGSAIPIDLPHSNRLLQALGVNATVDVVTHSTDTASGDLLMLCSDGVSGMISPAEIHATLSSDAPLQELGPKLIQMALDAGGKDNASAVLVRLIAA